MKNKKIIPILLITMIIIGLVVYNKQNTQAGIMYGDKNAPIEVVNYTSFGCGGCAIFHDELHETIKRYIDEGEIKFIEKPLDVKRFEFDEVVYKQMNEKQRTDFEELSKIYKTQDEWMAMESKEEVIEFLNLDKEENKKHIKDLKKITKEKEKLGLKEVPSVYINGEKISSDISVEEFEEKIDSLID